MQAHEKPRIYLSESSSKFYYGESREDRKERIIDDYIAGLYRYNLEKNPVFTPMRDAPEATPDPALVYCRACRLFQDPRFTTGIFVRMFEKTLGGSFTKPSPYRK